MYKWPFKKSRIAWTLSQELPTACVTVAPFWIMSVNFSWLFIDHGQNNLSLLPIPNNNYVLYNYYYDDPFSSVEKWLDQPKKN